MGHVHTDPRNVTRKLVITTGVTLAFVVVELGIGLSANSLALVGDALHNFTDSLALIIALLARFLEQRPPTEAKTYGYQRASILAAFINAGTLAGFTIFIFVEAARRFRHPEPVNVTYMTVTAFVALALNGLFTLWLRKDGQHDVGIRSAVVHMLGDALSSVGILVGAVLIRRTGMYEIDPFISIGIGALILWASWGILRETVNLLLEGTPAGIDPRSVERDLAAEEGVFGVHHLHIWALASSRPALSCHIQLGDVSLKSTGETLARVSRMLSERYRIAHTTIQFEHVDCPEDDPYCVPAARAKGR
jgi:cobalt-zinc-cadmium efflux system protein